MNPRITISFESHDPSDIDLALLYWRLDEEGRWLYTVAQIATHLSTSPAEISKRVATVGPAYLLSRRCESCFLPFRVSNRSEFAAIGKSDGKVCQACRDLAFQRQRQEQAEKTRATLREQEAIWLHNTSIDPGIDYSDLEYADVVRAFAVLSGSEQDREGNLRLAQVPRFSASTREPQQTLKNLFTEGVLLMGKGTPLDAFVPGASVDDFRYYPGRIVWRFASLDESLNSSVPRELARRIDNPDSEYEYWNATAELWWQEAFAEAFRYLYVQLEKYGLRVVEGDALNESINHALNNYSIPQVRNLLYKVARDIGAFSAERGISRPHAINAVPGKLTRTVDRYLANNWEVSPYVLHWSDEESLLTTTLFDRVLKTGVAGFKVLSGEYIQEQRLKALNSQPQDTPSTSAQDVF